MTTDDNAADPLGKFGNRAVLTKRETAEVLGRARVLVHEGAEGARPPWMTDECNWHLMWFDRVG